MLIANLSSFLPAACSAHLIFLYLITLTLLIEVKKSKVIPLHAIEALGARGGIAPTQTSALDRVSGQHYAPAALYPRGMDTRYPLYRSLGGPQSPSGRKGQRKNRLPLSGIEPRSSSP
jgi:hypothetical protein